MLIITNQGFCVNIFLKKIYKNQQIIKPLPNKNSMKKLLLFHAVFTIYQRFRLRKSKIEFISQV